MKKTGGQLVVECLEALGVEIIFGIPGAKVDSIFNALVDSPIRLVVCRHEQNAAFMAAIHGRVTGKPGVVLVTSGPGVSNLATGLLTATTEGDPLLALGANVARAFTLKESHQNTDNVKVLEGVTKSAVEVTTVGNIPEALANAYRLAVTPRGGACFISLPQDILMETTKILPITNLQTVKYGSAPENKINEAVEKINQAKLPILFLGQEASRPQNARAIRNLLKKSPLPVIGTYQAAGVISRDLIENFIGRVGLFRNQMADKVLAQADVVITIGYNPVEYDPEVWNEAQTHRIIHLDYTPAKIHMAYQPEVELLGDVEETLYLLSERINPKIKKSTLQNVKSKHQQFIEAIEQGKLKKSSPIHPLRFIAELRDHIDDDTVVISDVGTVYMWIARYFLTYKPHHLLFSNGQQTLGVALPWATSLSLINPEKKIISISGDGGFLFSAMELETAVREGANFIHFIWRDGEYNMVAEQEKMKYKRTSGVSFNDINVLDYAHAFGAMGLVLDNPDEFPNLFAKAISYQGPVLIDVPIDYTDNPELFKITQNILH